MTIIKVAEVIEQIGSVSGKKDKEFIISSHKDNSLFTDVLHFIFNPYIKTNIAKKKLVKSVPMMSTSMELKNIRDYMDYLSKSTGKDKDIAIVQDFIQSQPQEIHWLLEAMATKNLKVGITEVTINKVLGENFIPKFDVMLAEKYEDKKRDGTVKQNWKGYVGKNIVATRKLDGNRATVFVYENGTVEMFSRSGQELEGYNDLQEAFKSFPAGAVYDGEILAMNSEGLNSKELFQKTQKIVRKKGIKEDVLFHVFDMLSISDFQQGRCDIPCQVRKDALETIISLQNHELVHYVEPLYAGEFNQDIIQKLAEEAGAREEEGIMVQLADASYQCKRVKDILKVKVFESADLRVIGAVEGTGQNEGLLGAVIVDYKGFQVRVGSGFTKAERKEYWEDQSLILGKIVEVNYFEETHDQHGGTSLRFPTFKSVREDKTEPSYY